MGKSRAKVPRLQSVFHVANSKLRKAKAKRVTTGLKKINIVNNEKISMVDKAFTEVQKEVKQLSKGISAESQKGHLVSKPLESEPANVDAATDLLSQL
ncbi:uncharacterized protein LOC102560125 [Alligator mississippiensis]|uniref:Ribosomal biogenesis factor n=2 Tax=Alligator TaxID=8495 RepID=A0A151PH38_ALLMI|nr:uncharacterized protein LOC102375686 [Alligator sinensis]XP_006257814.1 uncharacterized protein LOC102560125 [Alligator mississippiensis]KYO48339.1 hypothetical protein Y1Q_0024702 [Alligator mississippiensis]